MVAVSLQMSKHYAPVRLARRRQRRARNAMTGTKMMTDQSRIGGPVRRPSLPAGRVGGTASYGDTARELRVMRFRCRNQ